MRWWAATMAVVVLAGCVSTVAPADRAGATDAPRGYELVPAAAAGDRAQQNPTNLSRDDAVGLTQMLANVTQAPESAWMSMYWDTHDHAQWLQVAILTYASQQVPGAWRHQADASSLVDATFITNLNSVCGSSPIFGLVADKTVVLVIAGYGHSDPTPDRVRAALEILGTLRSRLHAEDVCSARYLDAQQRFATRPKAGARDEPNDDMAHATPKRLDRAQVTGELADVGDVDWYRFEATGGNAEFSPGGTFGESLGHARPIDMGLYDARGTLLLDNRTQPYHLGMVLLPGTYYVRVATDAAHRTGEYGFSFIERPWAEEPDDTLANATPIERTMYGLAEARAALAPEGDVDWFAWNVTDCAPHTFNVTKQGKDQGLAFTVALYDANGTVIAPASAANAHAIYNLQPGRHSFAVRATAGIGLYSVRISRPCNAAERHAAADLHSDCGWIQSGPH